MKKSYLLLACLLTFNGFSLAAADTILGVYAGYNYWQHDLADSIDLDLSDTDIKRSEKGNVFYVALEHPVPFLPNIKVQQNEIKGQQAATIQFIGIDGVIRNINTISRSDLSHTDVTLYYELLDNWLNLDLGMSVKYFDGYAPSFNQVQSTDLDGWVPMLYAKGQFDLPLTGFSAYGSIETLSFDNNDVTDIEVGVNYESTSGLGAALGYRTLDVDLVNDNDLTSDTKADGFFVGINFHF